MWESRDKQCHYSYKELEKQSEIIPGINSAANQPLINPNNVLLPPLHIKLGLVKNFVKAIRSNSDAFSYLKELFPRLSEAKLKEGIFIGPQVRKLIKSTLFRDKLTEPEKCAWDGVVLIIHNFLGKNRSPDYREIVSSSIRNFEAIKVRSYAKINIFSFKK